MPEQQQFLNVIDRDEAESRFHQAINLQACGSESIAVSDSRGRVLAQDVTARVNVPSFDRSNFDGYAVRAADTHGADEENPARLSLRSEIVGTASIPEFQLQAGEAVAIATGAMIPRGADAILMIEYADTSASELLARRPVVAGFGIAHAGTDLSTGETVLRRGDLLTSRETGVLAAIGETEVVVFRQPVVGVISTGNEIVSPGVPMQPGLVYDSNAQILCDAVREAGGVPRMLGIVQDDRERIETLVKAGLADCDVLVLSGGTSKGAGDLSYRVVEAFCDPGIVAHGVALKPGKPICLAAHQDKPVVILPGFPTSAIFTFHEFVAPVIRRLAGKRPEARATVPARIAMKVNSQIGRREYLLVGLVTDNEGQLAAYPMGRGSGSVTTFSRADGFISIPRHDELLEANDPVSVQLLGAELEVADLVVIGSHCVGLDYLLSQMQIRGWRTKFLAVGSTAGLEAAKRGECDVAGIHLFDPQSNEYNRPFLTSALSLAVGYQRQQGVVCRAEDDRFVECSPSEIADRACGDSDVMMVNRNQGSGTRILVDQLLEGRQPAGYAVQSRNHNAVAAAIAQGRADWGVAIEHVARDPALAFIPLQAEHYDFAIPAVRVERPAVRAFRDLLDEPSVRDALKELGCVR